MTFVALGRTKFSSLFSNFLIGKTLLIIIKQQGLVAYLTYRHKPVRATEVTEHHSDAEFLKEGCLVFNFALTLLHQTMHAPSAASHQPMTTAPYAYPANHGCANGDVVNIKLL